VSTKLLTDSPNLDLKFSEALKILEKNDLRKVGMARNLLSEVEKSGRVDATHYLGLSYELEGDYEHASDCYLKGLQNKYRRSIYRLALLHGKGLLEDSDHDFYLTTLSVLAKEGHLPAAGKINRERLKGAFGIQAMVLGAFYLLPLLVKSTFFCVIDPDSWRLQT